MAVDRAVTEQASPVEITINIVNRGSRTVGVADPRSFGFCNHAFIVLDDAGRIVPLPSGFCILIGYALRELAPGDSVTIRDTWIPGSVGQYRLVARVIDGNHTPLPTRPDEVSVEVRVQ